jgi:hypothetical protein
MMRQADSYTRTLMRLQAERQKAEDAARPAAMQRAGYWFYKAANNYNRLDDYNRPVPGSVLGRRTETGNRPGNRGYDIARRAMASV